MVVRRAIYSLENILFPVIFVFSFLSEICMRKSPSSDIESKYKTESRSTWDLRIEEEIKKVEDVFGIESRGRFLLHGFTNGGQLSRD